MEPALRLIHGDAPVTRTDQVVSRHPGQRVPDKTDRTSIGLCATGRRQERREQDARARERLDDAGGLELLGLPLLPIVGLPNRWVTDCGAGCRQVALRGPDRLVYVDARREGAEADQQLPQFWAEPSGIRHIPNRVTQWPPLAAGCRASYAYASEVRDNSRASMWYAACPSGP